MPVFGSLSSQHTGARSAGGQAPLAGLLRQYPGLQQYAGQLGLTTDPSTLYGYSNTPPLVFPNQPKASRSTLVNAPPVLEGIDPSAGESMTSQMAAGNANAGASVASEQARGGRGQLSPLPRVLRQDGGGGLGRPLGSRRGQSSGAAAGGGDLVGAGPAPVPATIDAPTPLSPAFNTFNSGGGSGDAGSDSGAPAGGDGGAGTGDAGTGTASGEAATGDPGGEGTASDGVGDSGTASGEAATGDPGGEGTASDGDDGTGDGGGGGGGGGGGSVICTVLRDYGYMSDAEHAADTRFGALIEITRPHIMRGYHRWGRPLARAMRRHTWLRVVVALLAMAWVAEMAYVMGTRKRGSLIGRAIMKAGLPLCRWLGRDRT